MTTQLFERAASRVVSGALVALAFASAATAQVQTLAPSCSAPRGVKLWSQPSTWPGGVLPGTGTNVVIPDGETVWLDFDGVGGAVHVKSLTVLGELRFACGGGELRTNYVLVDGGTFSIGSAGRPYPFRVRIKLEHDLAATDFGGPTHAGDLLDQALVVQDGGVVEMFGRDHGTSWTQLAETAQRGATRIRLTENVAWKRGQRIVLASTDYDLNQAEVATVQQVNGDLVTLTDPLFHTHWGEFEGPYANAMTVDERGEVGLLTRSIVVEGSPFAAPDGRIMGGHTMVHLGHGMHGGHGSATPRMDVNWVEFRDLGREGTLGRYPLHAHLANSLPGTRFHACSITNSLNRVVSIHGVQDVEVSDCVALQHIGHGYYFEGTEGTSNVMTRNLGLGTRAARPGTEILPSDLEPGTFWLENPDNEITHNVAAGSEDFGFWWEPENFSTALPDFDGNVAHSNGAMGIYQDTRPLPNGGLIQDLTVYKNREHALWWRSYGTVTFRNIALADNRAGTYLASEGVQHSDNFSFIQFEDSLIVGETSNLGQPVASIELARGRSLPQKSTTPYLHGFLGPEWDALIGIEMYDGAVRIANTHFANFEDANDSCGFPNCGQPTTFQREAGAIGNVFYHNPWSFLTTNSVAGLSFENADEVFLRTPVGAPLGDNGIANTVFIDEDGSVTGTPMTYVRPINPFLTHKPASDTAFDPEWNAYTMEMTQPDGPGGAPVSYRYGLFQWQHAVADAPLLEGATVLRIPNDPTLSFESFDLDNATCNGNPNTLLPSAMVPGATYVFSNGALAPGDWPETFNVRWGGTAPGDEIVVAVPYPDSTATVRFNGIIDFAPASSAQALTQGSLNDHFLDTTSGLLYLKLRVGGFGTTVWDGLTTRVDVTP